MISEVGIGVATSIFGLKLNAFWKRPNKHIYIYIYICLYLCTHKEGGRVPWGGAESGVLLVRLLDLVSVYQGGALP